MKNLWLVYLYVIYLSSILKNTDEYLRNTLILSYSFLVIYEYKYIVDAFFEQQMHINTMALYFATDQWMETWTANKYATKAYSSLENVDKPLEAALLQSLSAL